jgi:uncharacterized membrane protein
VLERWDPLIVVHAIAATYALVLGLVQLVRRRRGDRPHVLVGRTWVAAMGLVIVSSFWIRTISGGFGWLHALSLFTALTVTMGVVAAKHGRIRAHRSFMAGSYFGLVGALVGVLAVPERRIPDTAAHHPGVLLLFVAAIVVTAAAAVWGVMEFSRRPGLNASHSER